ncbi:hypothetical protein HD554DRAFT_1158128 [Boletus coccyginus]|nr:hypothetical protein HD554DRAFT_1158128 [Boletus coccyginus]
MYNHWVHVGLPAVVMIFLAENGSSGWSTAIVTTSGPLPGRLWMHPHGIPTIVDQSLFSNFKFCCVFWPFKPSLEPLHGHRAHYISYLDGPVLDWTRD